VIKKLVTAAAFAAFGATSAFAADFQSRSYTKAMDPTYNWSGFYLGVTAGGGMHNTTVDDKDSRLSDSSLSFSKAFATLGGTVGYNYQFGAGVVGIEADLNWSNFDSSLSDPDWTSFHSTKSDWYSTVRGRVGLSVDRVLIYATGGVAFVDRKVTGSESLNLFDSTCGHCFSIKETSVGIVGGFGAEYALSGPWTMKAEYLYIATPTARAHDLGQFQTATFHQYAATDSVQVARLGLNYRFGN
jgi:outer membrane immunogenic protein